MVPMQSIDVPFAATMVSSGGAHMLPTSSLICLRKSSPATVASAPVSGVAWSLRRRYTIRFARTDPADCPVHGHIVTRDMLLECPGHVKIG